MQGVRNSLFSVRLQTGGLFHTGYASQATTQRSLREDPRRDATRDASCETDTRGAATHDAPSGDQVKILMTNRAGPRPKATHHTPSRTQVKSDVRRTKWDPGKKMHKAGTSQKSRMTHGAGPRRKRLPRRLDLATSCPISSLLTAEHYNPLLSPKGQQSNFPRLGVGRLTGNHSGPGRRRRTRGVRGVPASRSRRRTGSILPCALVLWLVNAEVYPPIHTACASA